MAMYKITFKLKKILKIVVYEGRKTKTKINHKERGMVKDGED